MAHTNPLVPDGKRPFRFWDALHGLLGIKLAMSTVFHPQTDGDMERVNRILEDMLRHYVNLVQDDWVEYLAVVEFAYKFMVIVSTEYSV